MLVQRILTVVIAAPFLIGVVVCPVPFVFKSFVAVCLFFALWEFFTIVGQKGMDRLLVAGLGLVHILYLLFCPEKFSSSLMEITLLLFVLFAYYCLTPKPNLEGVAQKISLSFFGIIYIGTFGSYVGLLRELPYGIFWVFALLAMTWLNDTFAYFVGHRFGKHRLAPLISPGKTWEGLVGGYVGSFLGFLIFWIIFKNPVALRQGFFLTLLVGSFGPLGDLSESLFKRSFGVKDSGNLIPGHGGMLDRIDALLFTAPVVYFYVSFFSS